ncbi:MAG: substrate-binding domain-containing protein [Bacteroidota bacterium]
MKNREGSTYGTAIILVDDNLRPIIEAEISTFEALFPEVNIRAHYVPGEQAIKQMLAQDSIRMAISTRRMSKEEETHLQARNISPKYAGIANTGIAIVIHPDNPFKQLSMEQLEGILTGELTNWGQLQGGNQSGDIALVFDHPQSSTLKFLTDSILTDKALTKQGIFAQQNTPEMIQYVATNPNAIGFGGWNWISDVDEPMTDSLRKSVKLVWLGRDSTQQLCLDESPYVGPYQSFLLQRCYPLTQTVTTVLRESNYGPATGFVSHLDGPQGQRVIHKGGLATVHGIDREIRLPAKEGAQSIRETIPESANSTK